MLVKTKLSKYLCHVSRKMLARDMIVLLLGSLLSAPSTAIADLVIRIPNETVVQSTSGTTGSFDVFVDVSGDPTSVISFNIDFLATGINASNITFGVTTVPISSPIFAGGVGVFTDFSPSILNVRAAHDVAVVDAATLNDLDTAALVHVPYTIDGGFVGTIDLSFGPTSLNELTDSSATALAHTLQSGSITVIAVPEGSIALFLTLLTFGKACWRVSRGKISSAHK